MHDMTNHSHIDVSAIAAMIGIALNCQCQCAGRVIPFSQPRFHISSFQASGLLSKVQNLIIATPRRNFPMQDVNMNGKSFFNICSSSFRIILCIMIWLLFLLSKSLPFVHLLTQSLRRRLKWIQGEQPFPSPEGFLSFLLIFILTNHSCLVFSTTTRLHIFSSSSSTSAHSAVG